MLYAVNRKIHTILIGTHKDLPRKIPNKDVEWLKDFFFIDYSFEISTKELDVNECEVALKLSAALMYKNISESSDK
jgi:hypothetical protein